MAFKPCTNCGEKFPAKATTVYAAWMGPEARVSYRLALCPSCVRNQLAPMVKVAIANPDGDACCQCGREIEAGDQFLQFLTVFQPKQEMEQFVLAACPDDYVVVRGRLLAAGVAMPDRWPVSSRGPENGQAGSEAPPW